MSETEIQWGEGCAEAVADVKSDKSATTWCLVVSDKPSSGTLVASGEGDGGELIALLEDDKVMYGLVRVEDVVEISTTVKFCYMRFVGPKVPFIKKGRYGLVAGAARNFFHPYHVDFDIERADEITAGSFLEKVQEFSMTADKTRNADEAAERADEFAAKEAARAAKNDPNRARQNEKGLTATSSAPGDVPKESAPKGAAPARTSNNSVGAPAANRSSVGIGFADDVGAAIEDLRNNDSPVDWVVAEYDNDKVKNIILKGAGEGGFDELMANISNDDIFYCLLRVTDVVDGHDTVKFVYISIVGDRAKVMKKGRISTHKGAVKEFFSHYHTSIEVGDPAEITFDGIMKEVGKGSGSHKVVVE